MTRDVRLSGSWESYTHACETWAGPPGTWTKVDGISPFVDVTSTHCRQFPSAIKVNFLLMYLHWQNSSCMWQKCICEFVCAFNHTFNMYVMGKEGTKRKSRKGRQGNKNEPISCKSSWIEIIKPFVIIKSSKWIMMNLLCIKNRKFDRIEMNPFLVDWFV